MELFPTNLTPHSEVPTSSALKSMMGKEEPKAAQLTIFYAGNVVVFDDFPSDKVKEIMSFANKGTSQTQNPSPYTYTQIQPSIIPNIPSRPIVFDIPIARKASLHRFLEKRKDRIAAKAPYQTSNSISAPPIKPVESIPWLELGVRSTQI